MLCPYPLIKWIVDKLSIKGILVRYDVNSYSKWRRVIRSRGVIFKEGLLVPKMAISIRDEVKAKSEWKKIQKKNCDHQKQTLMKKLEDDEEEFWDFNDEENKYLNSQK